MDGPLQVGVARTDITPPLTIPYLGFDPRHAFFEGVHDALYARALAVGDGSSDVVLIVADAIGFSNQILGAGQSFAAAVRAQVEQRSGVPGSNVMLACTHAHSTPETLHFRSLADQPGAEAWLRVLVDQLASCAALAVRGKQPCRLKAGESTLAGLSSNRRVPPRVPVQSPEDTAVETALTDPQLTVLLFESLSDPGQNVIVANFACHPVTVQAQPLVSADFPGVAMRLIEQTVPGCQGSVFVQGACGDLNPARGHTGSFEDVQRYALMLAGETIMTVGSLGSPAVAAAEAVVAAATCRLELPGRELPARRPLQDALAALSARLAAALPDAARRELRQQLGRTQEALRQIELGRDAFPAEVQVLRIGDVAVVGLPGEPFVALGLEIKRRSAAAHTIVAGYANDYLGYLAPLAEWKRGGYEVGQGPWARVGPRAAELLVETAVEAIRSLWPAQG
jgi:neutral ceramidase